MAVGVAASRGCVILSFPHNPTTTCIDLATMARLVEFAHEHEIVLVHDFAYSDTYFDGYRPPSMLQVPGAKEVAVELYTMTKSFSMAGWRVGFLVGNAEVVQALTKLKSYLDYGTFQPIQIAATVAMNEAPEYPKEVNEIYLTAANALCDGLARHRLGRAPAERDDVRLGADPRAVPRRWARSTSPSSSSREAKVATSAGVGFGAGRRRVRPLRARSRTNSGSTRGFAVCGRRCPSSGRSRRTPRGGVFQSREDVPIVVD